MNFVNIEHLGLLHPDKNVKYDSVLGLIGETGKSKDKKIETVYEIVNSIGELREDKVKPSPNYDTVFLNAKKREGNYFVAPQAVE